MRVGSGKTGLVTWSNVMSSFHHMGWGCVNIGSLKATNLALLGKWCGGIGVMGGDP